MRGTFANIRIRNRMTPEIEGGVTKHFPSGEVMAIYDAAMKYQAEGRPVVIFAGKEYGTGSSRDWAAKGTQAPGRPRRAGGDPTSASTAPTWSAWAFCPCSSIEDGWQRLNLTGEELITIRGMDRAARRARHGHRSSCSARRTTRSARFQVTVVGSIPTPSWNTSRAGGVMPYVLRNLAAFAKPRRSPPNRSAAVRGGASAPHALVRSACPMTAPMVGEMLFDGWKPPETPCVLRFRLSVVWLGLCALVVAPSRRGRRNRGRGAPPSRPVVVELFTAQGCTVLSRRPTPKCWS